MTHFFTNIKKNVQKNAEIVSRLFGWSLKNDETREKSTPEIRDMRTKIRYISLLGAMTNPSAVRITSRPSNIFSSYLAKRFESALIMTSGRGGWIRISTIPAYFSGGYATVFTKSLSCVTSMRHSFSQISAMVASNAPIGARVTSPNVERNFATSRRTFSSTSNRMNLCDKRSADFGQLGGKLQCGCDVFLGESGICTKNVTSRFSCGKHLKYLPYHDASTFENRFAVANGRSGSNVRCKVVHMPSIVAQGEVMANALNRNPAVGRGFLQEARVLPKMSWLQREIIEPRANARRSGCQPATALGIGCRKTIAKTP